VGTRAACALSPFECGPLAACACAKAKESSPLAMPWAPGWPCMMQGPHQDSPWPDLKGTQHKPAQVHPNMMQGPHQDSPWPDLKGTQHRRAQVCIQTHTRARMRTHCQMHTYERACAPASQPLPLTAWLTCCCQASSVTHTHVCAQAHHRMRIWGRARVHLRRSRRH